MKGSALVLIVGLMSVESAMAESCSGLAQIHNLWYGNYFNASDLLNRAARETEDVAPKCYKKAVEYLDVIKNKNVIHNREQLPKANQFSYGTRRDAFYPDLMRAFAFLRISELSKVEAEKASFLQKSREAFDVHKKNLAATEKPRDVQRDLMKDKSYQAQWTKLEAMFPDRPAPAQVPALEAEAER